MKKIIFALFFVFTLQVSYTQWVAQNIPGNLYFLNGIDFYNAQTGAVGGWVGTFSPEEYPQNLSEMNGFSQLGRALYTTNGGINWNYSVIPDSLRILSALQYIDQQLVYGFASKNVTAS